MPFPLPSDTWIWFVIIGIAVLSAGFLIFQWWQKRREPGERLTRPSEARAYLVIHDGQSTRHPIGKIPFRIGRDPDSGLLLNDSSVSRRHAEIVRNANGVYSIKDLDSLNGVFINDKRVKTAVLSEGCEIDIGDIRLTFTQLEATAAPPPPSARA